MAKAISLTGMLVLAACGQSVHDNTSFQVKDKDAKINKQVEESLAFIQEKFSGKSHLLVLEKDYWINKKIWVSIGVERSTITGVAGSVMGYIPAYLRNVNGLLVLERDNTGKFAGTALTPDTAINAYPIIEEYNTAIVVDISSPKSPYGLSNLGFHAQTHANTELKPRLEYVKGYNMSEDGISFKSVVNAVSPVRLYQKGSGYPEELAGHDPYSISLTIRTDWKLPTPTEGYEALDSRAQPIGFFYSDPKLEDGGTQKIQYVNRIATNKVHIWEMSANTPEEYREAVREGALAWNDAFGKEVIQVRVAPVGKDITDPKTSNIVWDDNKAIGFAFANWRDDPHTGEIVQGQVYLSGAMWAHNAGLVYDMRKIEKMIRDAMDADEEEEIQDPDAPVDPSSDVTYSKSLQALKKSIQKEAKNLKSKLENDTASTRAVVSLNPSMNEGISKHKGFCQRELKMSELKDLTSAVISLGDSFVATTEVPGEEAPVEETPEEVADRIERKLKHMPYPKEGMSREEFQKAVVKTVVMHELGHTLGLRHNFMASTDVSETPEGQLPSSSIMDYNDLVVDTYFETVGDYDKTIVQMGYNRVPPSSRVKYCTDEHAQAGVPNCYRHDHSDDPIDFFITSQETSLIMSLYNAQRGNMRGMQGHLFRSLNTVMENMKYINFPLMNGIQIDPQFPEKQVKAHRAIVESGDLYGLAFPDQIKSVYQGLTKLVVGSTTQEGAAQSSVKDKLIETFVSTVKDEAAILDRDSRLSGVGGLIKLKDAQARFALKQLMDDLRSSAKLPNDERGLDAKMMDEFIAGVINNALDSYFAE